MQNRYFRLFSQERRFKLALIILLLVIILLFYLWARVRVQLNELSRLKLAEQRIAEAALDEQRHKKLELESRVQEIGLLKGIFWQDGIPIALIGEEIYKEGDFLGNYIILKITPNSVILEEQITHRIRELSFPWGHSFNQLNKCLRKS
jgi:hypothetical protein